MSAEGRFQSPHITTLDQAFDPQDNAFAFLRFALAALVMISHCYTLGGFGHDPLDSITRGRHTLGLLAVGMFFVLSGFLITSSALRTSSVSRYLWHRFLRIFPGYWVCLLVCALIIAPFVCRFEYGVVLPIFSAPRDSPQAFIVSNLPLFHLPARNFSDLMTLRPMSVAGVMRHNPFPWLINGSLWTLPYECACYLTVALLAGLAVLRRARVLVLLLFLILWLSYAFRYLSPTLARHWIPESCGDLLMLSPYFAAGSVSYLYREKILVSPSLVVVALSMLIAALIFNVFGIIAPIAVPYLFLWFGCKLSVRRFDAPGDFSYGLYIYAFPVQQTLAFFEVQHGGLAFYFICSLLLTLILAVLSYHFVEAPCLKMRNLRRRRPAQQLLEKGVSQLARFGSS